MNAKNQEQTIQSLVGDAYANKTSLQIIAGNSKAFYGRAINGQPLNVSEHQGIVNYHPSELVITARSGTPLAYLEQVLTEHGQMLAFEPPHFAPSATLGGAIACGFSGPRRPFAGAARDFVLGSKILTGRAEILSFGGEVMKNVAGYDVSRLMVGALGTLGVLLEISLKVLPLPDCELTLALEQQSGEVINRMSEISLNSQPVSGVSFDGKVLYVRLSGSENSVKARAKKLGGEILTTGNEFWMDLREQQLGFFQSEMNLWRVSVPPATPEMNIEGQWFYEWGGALRWLKTESPAEKIFSAAQRVDGHAVLFRSIHSSDAIFQPLPETNLRIQQNLKSAFDPGNILNPHKIYSNRSQLPVIS